MIRFFYTILLLTTLSSSILSQDFWTADMSREADQKKYRENHPTKFEVFTLDISGFINATRNAPKRTALGAEDSNIILGFPLPDGTLENFRIIDAELMHPELEGKFPQLKSYIGKGIDDPTADIRITYSPYHGFHGMIKSGLHSTVYIDPYTTDLQKYMVYYRKDVQNTNASFQCHTQHADSDDQKHRSSSSSSRLGDCNLRRYRLAQSCTGEYAQYHIGQAGGTTGSTAGDKAIVQSAMNITMARVNGVFEIDMGITMQFIANNDLIIYLNGGSDPWTNEWNTKTAQTIDAQIGVANYDIGHNFNDTGGGNAGCLTCVCSSASQSGTHKGRGYTGRAAPIGDPFDIDYVAHEMGHQFGAYHTQSNSNCRSGNGTTEVEPGSGSTIMGYAGICAANVQNNSDDYFHYVNIRDVVDAINNGSQNGCAELITSGNSSPTADAGSNYTIPISTPFLLEGTGTDPNDAGLTYCWEENDPENPNSNNAPPSTRTQGPMFRSFDPVTIDYRYFPNLNAIINNTNPTFEVLPSVTRNMDFAFTVRDNNLNSGCTESDLMTVTTDDSAGPFLVTSPNTAVTWNGGDSETVTWDVAGTNLAPVNCANVDIYLSTDGGLTFPIILASNVANDGSELVGVPSQVGSNNRVMIKCSDNIFFDISNQDFTINSLNPFVNLENPSATITDEGTSCGTRTFTFDVAMNLAPSATTMVTLATSGTATLNEDYTISTTSLNFTVSNWNTPQTITITIEEDGILESNEIIAVEIQSVTGSDAQIGGVSTLNLEVRDDEVDPFNSGSITTLLLTQDFESGFPASWSRSGSADVFLTGNNTSLSSGNWTIPGANASQIVASNDDDCNCDMSNEVLTSETVVVSAAAGYTLLSLSVDIYYEGGTYQGSTETAFLEISKDGGVTFPISYTLVGSAGAWQNLTYDLTAELPSSGSENWVFRWVYNDAGGWLYGLAIDNVEFSAESPAVTLVQDAVNSSGGFAEHDLPAGKLVHFFDRVTGKIICSIDNTNSAHNYGCTRVEVDRAGNGSVTFVNTDATTYLHSKSIKIIPEFNTASDPNGYTISLYYTDAEVLGWEAATGESKNNAFIHKTDGANTVSDVTAGNPSNVPITSINATYATMGADHQYSATFTNGFSGFGVGINTSSLLPVELVVFKGEFIKTEGNRLSWTTATEENSSLFEIEHSLNLEDFQKIGEVDAAENSLVELDYQYLEIKPRKVVNYYRLKMVDLDGSFEYSNIVSIDNRNEEIEMSINPNPTKGAVLIQFNYTIDESIQIEVYDVAGKMVKTIKTELVGMNQIDFDISDFPTGSYYIKIKGSDMNYTEKLIKY